MWTGVSIRSSAILSVTWLQGDDVSELQQGSMEAGAEPTDDLDALVVGAGFAGLYMLHRLRGLGLKVRVFEAADSVGGTWYWNRYPGARCDVPSLEYSYGFSSELQQEWEWTEIMPSQPEVLKYLNHVADRFDLRRDIRFETRVTAAAFDEATSRWLVETDSGQSFSAKYCIMATGCLSAPLTPDINGMDTFDGPVHFTNSWPKEGVQLAGKRVGIVGTGSSGVQSIPVIAEEAGHLFVFQRTATYSFPAQNAPLDLERQRQTKEHYGEIREMQRQSFVGISGFGMPAWLTPPSKSILEASEEERKEALDRYGFRVIRAFSDVGTNLEANEAACELYREQIRRVIDDPAVAERLSPRGYPVGCKRQVIDTSYYITFNRNNVTLVDLREGGIEEVTPRGVRTTSAEYELDVLVFATGFDAMTGALGRIDIRGRGGRALKEKWADGPRSYLGIQSAGFPNLFTITGPGSPSVLSNMVVSIEQHVDWITDCITYLRKNQIERIEPTVEAEDAWVEHVNQVAQGTMFTAPSCNSWYLGANVPGKPRIFMPYIGGVGNYRQKCDEIVAKGYEGFALTA